MIEKGFVENVELIGHLAYRPIFQRLLYAADTRIDSSAFDGELGEGFFLFRRYLKLTIPLWETWVALPGWSHES